MFVSIRSAETGITIYEYKRRHYQRRNHEGVISMATLIPYGFNNDTLRRTFDPFDGFFASPFTNQLASMVSDGGFKMNVEDAGEAYVVSAILPDVGRDEIDVELNEGRLSISVEKKESEEEQKKNWLLKETGDWRAVRTVTLKDAATEGLTARLDGGVLTINVPKQSEKASITKVVID